MKLKKGPKPVVISLFKTPKNDPAPIKTAEISIQTDYAELVEFLHFCCYQCSFKSKFGKEFKGHLDENHPVKSGHESNEELPDLPNSPGSDIGKFGKEYKGHLDENPQVKSDHESNDDWPDLPGLDPGGNNSFVL